MIVTEDELEKLGRLIGESVELPVVFALTGPLGAGKSVLARAIGRGSGVEERMPSPTFNLLYRYATPRGEVVHVDLYRLEDPQELHELGWAELGEAGELTLIEWPERAGRALPRDRWEVALELLDDEPGRRRVTFHRHGAAPALPVGAEHLAGDAS